MLLFLDESYEEDEKGGFRFAYAGFAVDEQRYRGLVAAVYQAKHRYIAQVSSEMTPQERIDLGNTKLLDSNPPERAEIKANKLMGKRQVERFEKYGFAPGVALVEEWLRAMREADATVFGVLSYPQDTKDVLNPAERLPVEHIRLFERVEKWMAEQHEKEMVSVIPDTIDNYRQNMSSCLSDFLFRSHQGKAMRHIVVTPFWVDSSVTVGAQLADVVAYLIMNTMRPTEKQNRLVNLWRLMSAMEFHSIDGETCGIKTIRRKNQQAGANTR